MNSGMKRKSKRMLDVTVAIAALIVLSPLLVLIFLSIRLSMGRPALFRQTRAGYRGKPFKVLKFRTLTQSCDSDGNLLPDVDRRTPLGDFLRRWSLDEFPQLWNVIRGEMSLVGPRPLLLEYLQKYTPEQARRHDMKPGLTGWAQLHGRQNLLFSKRLEMDVWYVDQWSLLLDLKLIFRTLLQLHKLSAAGATPDIDKTDDLGLFALIQKRKKDGNPASLP